MNYNEIIQVMKDAIKVVQPEISQISKENNADIERGFFKIRSYSEEIKINCVFIFDRNNVAFSCVTW